MARKTARRPSLKRRAAVLVVSREELDQLRAAVEDIQRILQTQFQRIAQMQAELDGVKNAWIQLSKSRSGNWGN
jgi:hypothetical protein